MADIEIRPPRILVTGCAALALSAAACLAPARAQDAAKSYAIGGEDLVLATEAGMALEIPGKISVAADRIHAIWDAHRDDPYLAPEVLAPNAEYDPRLTDIWSVAIIRCRGSMHFGQTRT